MRIIVTSIIAALALSAATADADAAGGYSVASVAATRVQPQIPITTVARPMTPGRAKLLRMSLRQLTGEVPPSPQMLARVPMINAQAQKVIAQYRLDLIRAKIHLPPIACNSSLHSWDWRTRGKVTPPKSQECGDCWAFASAGQVESAMLMSGWTMRDVSEQNILSCSGAGDCGGGRRWDALPWVVDHPVASEASYPYEHGVASVCRAGVMGSNRLIAAGWIDSTGTVPSTTVLKNALCQYGPISVSILATDAFQHYPDAGEVFNQTAPNLDTNHAILLIGWDDARGAWLMKNSWSADWGYGGYGWVHYGANNIGKWPVYAVAPHPTLVLSPQLVAQISKFRQIALPAVPLRPIQLKPMPVPH